LPPHVGQMLAALRHLLLAIDAVPVPTLAAIHGMALGGGFEVALAADRRIATVDARVGSPEIQLGVMAPAAAVLLPGIIGAGNALHFLTVEVEVNAVRAAQLGLVDRVVPEGELDAAVGVEAAALSGRSRSAIVATKKAVRCGVGANDLSGRLQAAEQVYLSDVAESPDGVAGLRAFLDRTRRR